MPALKTRRVKLNGSYQHHNGYHDYIQAGPRYVVMIPLRACDDTAAELTQLIALFNTEAFEVDEDRSRLAIVIGINYQVGVGRITPSIESAVEQALLDAQFSLVVFAFSWEAKKIPYGILRDYVLHHQAVASAVEHFRQDHDPVYGVLLDGDVQSLKLDYFKASGSGRRKTVCLFDFLTRELVRTNQQVISVGYAVDSELPLANFRVMVDMACRLALTGKYCYHPEPGFCFLFPDELDQISCGEFHLESRNLLRSLQQLQLGGYIDTTFLSRGLPLKCPPRFIKGKVKQLKTRFPTPSELANNLKGSQSHAHPRIVADQLYALMKTQGLKLHPYKQLYSVLNELLAFFNPFNYLNQKPPPSYDELVESALKQKKEKDALRKVLTKLHSNSKDEDAVEKDFEEILNLCQSWGRALYECLRLFRTKKPRTWVRYVKKFYGGLNPIFVVNWIWERWSVKLLGQGVRRRTRALTLSDARDEVDRLLTIVEQLG